MIYSVLGRAAVEVCRVTLLRFMLVTFRLKTTFIAAVLCSLLVPVFAGTAELFRYRLQTKGGRQFEYVFESSAQPSSNSIAREEATRIAADWMATFYHLQLGSIEYAEFREKPLPHWLVCFADTASGPIRHLLFAVVLADGKIVQPTVSERL
jgi:hypothetical protein